MSTSLATETIPSQTSIPMCSAVSNNKALFAVGLITLGGMFLRLLNLGSGSIWYDEAFSIYMSRQELSTIIYGNSGDTMPPLHFFALHYWMGIGQSEFVLRLLSAMLGVGSIPLVYFIGARLFSREAGIFSAMIVATAPYHIYWAQETRMYTMLSFFSLLSVSTFIMAWKENKRLYWVSFTAAIALTFYTHNLAVLVLASVDLFMLLRIRRARLLWRPVMLSHTAAILLFSPWLALLPGQISKVVGVFWIDEPHALRWALSIQDFLFHTERLRWILPWGLDYFSLFYTLLVCTFAIHILVRNAIKGTVAKDSILLVVVLIFTPMAALYVLSIWRSFYADRAMPISAAGLALALGYLFSQARYRPKFTMVLLFPLVIALSMALVYKYNHHGSDHLPFREAVATIKENYEDGDSVIYTNKATFFPGHFYHQFPNEYMLHDNPTSIFNDLSPRSAEAMGIRSYTVAEAVPGYDRIWVMIIAGPDMDYDVERVTAPLSQTHSRTLAGRWKERLFLLLFERDS